MTNRILLYATTNWPSAARYAGGFFAAGVQVHIACPNGSVSSLSRYVSRVHRYDPLVPHASLERAIAAATPALIVPCDDRAVTHLVALHRRSEREMSSPVPSLIARSLGSPQNYARVMSRCSALNDLDAMGIRVPRTLTVEGEEVLGDRLAAIGLPAVLKTDGSWGGNGVVIAHTAEDAREAYRKLSRAPSRLRSLLRAVKRKDKHFLLSALKPEKHCVSIQKFIAGYPAASAFAAKDGRILASFHYDTVVSEKTTGPPNVIRRVDDPDMDKAVEAAARCFGLSGLHGLDYMRDRAGKVHLIEINPRATQGGMLPFGPGHDLCAALAQTLSPIQVGMRPAIVNNVVAFFPREIQRDPESPYLVQGHHDVPYDDPVVLRAIVGKRRAHIARRGLPSFSFPLRKRHA